MAICTAMEARLFPFPIFFSSDMHALTPPKKYHLFLFLKTSPVLPPLHAFSFLYLQTSLEGDKSWTLEVFDSDTARMVLSLDSKKCCGRGANPQSAVR